jgi:4a-hydroxytetrahydrobiopterin dehydratase
MSQPLKDRNCSPELAGNSPLDTSRVKELAIQLADRWTVVDNHHLSADWTFDDFASALAWVNRVGEEAEDQNHHPDIRLGYGKVHVDLHTHTIDGLSENDFILAARLDALGNREAAGNG